MKRRLIVWFRGTDAVAAIESGFLFPVLMTILLGVMDIGAGLTVSQKVTNASHVIADLLTREDEVTDPLLADATLAGRLVLLPYESTEMGWDVAGIRFIGVQKTPTVQWRDTFNMDPNPDVTTDSAGLGDQDEGVIAVTVRYDYSPFFSGLVMGAFTMQEVAYARGRKGVFVARDTQG